MPRVNTAPQQTSVIRLIVTGGGTGGRTLDVLWIGTAEGLEARVTSAEGIPFTTVATGKIRRHANPLKMVSPANVRDMARVPLGVAQPRSPVSAFRPDVVLATGGYVAVPGGLAAKMCRVPLVLHEQTPHLCPANRKLASSATRIAVSSESPCRSCRRACARRRWSPATPYGRRS